MKCMTTEVFCCKSDIQVRPVWFSIWCTPADSSAETQMCSTILLFLFTSKYDVNGSRLNYSAASGNKFKYIYMREGATPFHC